MRLSDGKAEPVGTYIHNETPEWTLSSDLPINFVKTCDDVYDHLLPGRLGMFVYPHDVRFHLKHKKKTTRAEFEQVKRKEQQDTKHHMVNMQHLSVETFHTDDFVSNEEAVESDDECEQDDEDDEEEGQDVIDECIESEYDEVE
jgi:hypothetical protein